MADEKAPDLRLEREGGIAYLILDNPARLNALTSAMWAAIPRLVTEAEAIRPSASSC